MRIMGYEDEVCACLRADVVDQLEYLSAVILIQTLAGLVEDQQTRRFHHGSRDQHHPSFTVREMIEDPV